MFPYAQTNLQLYQQLQLTGYTTEDIARLACTYNLAVPMFSGLYRVSGKPFISHLIGTASILVSDKARTEVVQAGMLHAVYMNGDMGFQPGTRQTERKRQHMRGLIGEDAENLISVYDAMRWTPETIRTYHLAYATLSPTQQSVLIIRLANVYEDFMDDGMCFHKSTKALIFQQMGVQSDILALCAQCRWPALVMPLTLAFNRFNSGAHTIPQFIEKNERSTLVLPPSASRNLLSAGQGWVARRLRRLGLVQ